MGFVDERSTPPNPLFLANVDIPRTNISLLTLASLQNSEGKGKVGKGGKGGGSNSSSDDSRNFSPDELKKLFAAPHDTNCDTYDLITSMKGHRSVDVEEDEEDEEDEMVMGEEEENNGMELDEEETIGTGKSKKKKNSFTKN